MKAVQYVTYGAGAEVRDVEKPSPGAGEVLLRVTAAGACHSDAFIMGMPAGPENPYKLARRGAITIRTQEFTLDEGPGIYDLMHDAKLKGRAVINPARG